MTKVYKYIEFTLSPLQQALKEHRYHMRRALKYPSESNWSKEREGWRKILKLLDEEDYFV